MDMPSSELALPMLGMMILTLLVWAFMFIRRISFAQSNNIDIEDFKTPADVQSLIPGAACFAQPYSLFLQQGCAPVCGLYAVGDCPLDHGRQGVPFCALRCF